MSKKKTKKHNFDHLIRTKTAAKIVEAKESVQDKPQSPLDRKINRDLRQGLLIIAVFVVVILLSWLFFGKNGQIYDLTNKIDLFK